MTLLRRVHLVLEGVVQGVGFRPFLAVLAGECGIRGWARNLGSAVELEAEAEGTVLSGFLEQAKRGPRTARVTHYESHDIPATGGPTGFRLCESLVDTSGHAGPAVPPDLAPCEPCRQDLFDPANRRYGYAFTSCAHCGPRWSILQSLPYDRSQTTMAPFPLCPSCQSEFLDPQDRRFHAQPLACPECGPKLELRGASGSNLAQGADALEAAAARLRGGELLALLGVGGFQLLADATSAQAVQALRTAKVRPGKPLAVMVRDLEAASALATISPEAAAALSSASAPVVLLPARRRSLLAETVAPGRDEVGIMLPASPLHLLLTSSFRKPLVCTSGNLSGVPMVTELESMRLLFGEAVPSFLTHDRAVVRVLDDSVLRPMAGRVQAIRRARGYAPTSWRVPNPGPVVVAVGAHQKSAPALFTKDHLTLGAHVGTLGTQSALDLLRVRTLDLARQYQVVPEVVACDLHPDYQSTTLARELAATWGARIEPVQHHHAHVAAVLAEHSHEGEVTGIVWDGVGLGSDRSAWGGEVLRVKGSTMTQIESLRQFPLPGGDAAARSPRRSLVGLAVEGLASHAEDLARELFPGDTSEKMLAIARSPRAPRTSSVGRLLDGVAACLRVRTECDHEGQAASELEALARRGHPGAVVLPELQVTTEEGVRRADWAPMLATLLEGPSAQADQARAVHEVLVQWAVEAATRAGLDVVVLAGGCFQNRFLLESCVTAMTARGHRVLTAADIPTNDGGLAAGQAWVAAKREAGSHVPGNSR